ALAAAGLVALGWPLVRAVGRAAPHRATTPEAAAAPAVAAVPAAAEQSVPPPALVAEAAAPAPGELEMPAETALASAAPQDRSPAAVGGSDATGIRPPPNTAPQIVGYQPRRRDGLSVMEGGPVDFSVRATDQDLTETVSYAWILDGRRVRPRPSWRFVAPLRLQGRFARVAVNRTELDRHGRVLASQRESYELEKQPNGFIGLRPAAVSAR